MLHYDFFFNVFFVLDVVFRMLSDGVVRRGMRCTDASADRRDYAFARDFVHAVAAGLAVSVALFQQRRLQTVLPATVLRRTPTVLRRTAAFRRTHRGAPAVRRRAHRSSTVRQRTVRRAVRSDFTAKF